MHPPGLHSQRALIAVLALIWGASLAAADVPGYPATKYYVALSGIDTQPGTATQPFRTIQKALNLVVPGDVVEVASGDYDEALLTKREGTAAAPISLVAANASEAPRLAGIQILHSYFTIDGFSLNGTHAAVASNTAAIYVRGAVTGARIINNLVHDTPRSVSAISFENTASPPKSCIIKNNIFTRLGRHMVMITGTGHLVEHNNFVDSNGWDGIWLFGNGHIVQKNFFKGISEAPGNGNHVDIVQGFDDNGNYSFDMHFTGNFIIDSVSQMGQINNDRYSSKAYSWTFSDNVFSRVNPLFNLNASIKGVKIFKNTFVSVGTVVLGQVSADSEIHSNTFVGNGSGSAGSGWYTAPRGVVTPAQFWSQYSKYVSCDSLGLPMDTKCQDEQKRLIKVRLLDPLQAKGYLGAPNSNSEYPVLPAILSVSSASSLGVVYPFTEFQDVILLTVRQIDLAKSTFSAHHNFVAGLAPDYPSKPSDCTEPYRPFHFCESAGLNGGHPEFANISDPLGSDKIPFTSDDGLIPLTSSKLCASGQGGGAIGAYSCTGVPSRAGALPGRVPVPSNSPAAPSHPTGLRVK